MRFGRRIGVANGQIEALIAEVDKAISKFKLDMNVGVVFEKTRNHGCQMLPPQSDGRSHPHQAARCPHHVAHGAVAVADAAERGLQISYQLLARVCQAD